MEIVAPNLTSLIG